MAFVYVSLNVEIMTSYSLNSQKDDLPMLAERFTTSKLSTFSDLSKLTTYGFRGEALASISHVSHLTVITKVKSDSCAWKCVYFSYARNKTFDRNPTGLLMVTASSSL